MMYTEISVVENTRLITSGVFVILSKFFQHYTFTNIAKN